MKKAKQIAVITGASSGIGREFAIQTAKHYPRLDQLWVVARRKDKLSSLKEDIGTLAPHIEVVCLPLDLSLNTDIFKIKERLESQKPSVRLLVNCAGYGRLGPFADGDYETEIGMVDVNCRGLTAVTHLILPYMPPKSRIIQLASAAAFIPQKNFAVYAASKAYVDSFSMGLRAELKSRKITVTSVCPGPVDTDFFHVADPDDETKLYKKLARVPKEAVVAHALHCARHGKARSVYSPLIKAGYVLSHLVP